MNSGAETLCIIVLGLTIALLIGQALSRLSIWWRNRRRKRRDEDVEPAAPRAAAPARAPVASASAARREKPSEGPQIPERLRRGVAHECAAHARAAFAGGALVEAYYFGSVARLCGHRQVSTVLGQIRIVWQRAGCPSEKHLIHEAFSPEESAIGRALLRIDTRVDPESGYALLTDLRNDGNEVARDLLRSLPPNPFETPDEDEQRVNQGDKL